MHTKNGKSIMKVIDPRLVAANANAPEAVASEDGLPF
jgi:hypothetical protein